MKCRFNLHKNSTINVSNKLMRGRAPINPYRIYKMRESGITQIVDLRNSSPIAKAIEKFFCNIFGIKYVNCRYSHRLNYIPERNFFSRINTLIENNSGITYLHCQKGKHRTGICAAIYEKECLHKQKSDVISNLLNLGFRELLPNKTKKKAIKYRKIFDDFINKYYSESSPI